MERKAASVYNMALSVHVEYIQVEIIIIIPDTKFSFGITNPCNPSVLQQKFQHQVIFEV